MDDLICIDSRIARAHTHRSLTSNCRRMSMLFTLNFEPISNENCSCDNVFKMKWTFWERIECEWVDLGEGTDKVLYCYCSTVHNSLNWVESMLIIIKMEIAIMFVSVCVRANVCVCVPCNLLILSTWICILFFLFIDWPSWEPILIQMIEIMHL